MFLAHTFSPTSYSYNRTTVEKSIYGGDRRSLWCAAMGQKWWQNSQMHFNLMTLYFHLNDTLMSHLSSKLKIENIYRV
jgi:hypothetical protein